jgi:hypothetical protein
MFTLGGVVAACTNTKKAADWFKKVQEVPEQGFFLWKAVESIARPLELCIRLNKRAEFLPFCDAPVTMTRHCLHKCENLLSREDEEDGRPEASEGWTKWMGTMKDGVTRTATLPKLIVELGLCMQSLQLALVSISVAHGGRAVQSLVFNYDRVAVEEDAYRIVMDFEFGRKESIQLAVGEVHRLSSSPVRRGQRDWQAIGPMVASLVLEKTETGEDVALLKLSSAESSKLESDEDEGQQEPVELQLQLVIDSNFSVRRVTGGLLPASVPANDSTTKSELVYLLSTASDPAVVLFEFESANGIAAEVFEAVLFMFLCKGGPSQQLAEVVDFDKPGSVQAWKAKFGREVGSFGSREAQGVGGDAASSGSETGLQSPMSKLTM